VNAPLYALVVFACVFGGALLGVGLHLRLPEHHRDQDSKDVVKLVMGLVGTMAALVLSLLIASAHTFYQTQQAELRQLSADVVLLDQVLDHFGSQAQSARRLLLVDVVEVIRSSSPVEGAGGEIARRNAAGSTNLFDEVQGLKPVNPGQGFDQSRALSLLTTIGSIRLLIHEQTSSPLPDVLIVVLVVWLSLLFVGFGLFAKVNFTVLGALFLGAISVATAIFLMLEMSHPYSGLMQISNEPLQNALEQLRH
jgi:hypothetical protein